MYCSFEICFEVQRLVVSHSKQGRHGKPSKNGLDKQLTKWMVSSMTSREQFQLQYILKNPIRVHEKKEVQNTNPRIRIETLIIGR